MKFKDKYFPYPVIRPYPEDYKTTTFNVSIMITEDERENEIILNISVLLNNKDIKSLVSRKHAIYALHVEETETMFRKVFYSVEDEFEIKISLDLVRNKLELMPFIIVTKSIYDYNCLDLHEDFEKLNISFDPNNIIGIGDPYTIKITKEDDEIKNVGSIFMVVKKDEIKNIFELELSPKRIIILISSKTYELYMDLIGIYNRTKDNGRKALLAIMVLPAFVETLNILKAGAKNHNNALWYDPLIEAFKNKGLDLEEQLNDETGSNRFDPYNYAQIIFDGLIHEGLTSLHKLEVGD